ncbi:MAG TPA: malto-oligosyltrehalose trehalohydrolase [Solirubrobacteraceae bacterium]|nr:malto-oligosyltrehalose trehalohydrolase [Solirubrobacteraceae bacterium]
MSAGAPAYPWLAPLGARPDGDHTSFRVWAPLASEVAVRHGRERTPMRQAGLGVWEASAAVAAGEDYWFELQREGGGRARRLPDPCSRHQPEGLRGPSRVFDARKHAWTDRGFRAPSLRDLVLYELHVGTFTAAGTFDAAREQLPRLAELGVNAIELMPVAEGPGERGWGYDGVYISAAHHAYGGPAGLQRLVDAAHAHGIAVILDVVYNHVGASGGRALEAFGPYFTDRYQTFWGEAINYDDELCDPVREWVLQSAAGWVSDFHVDGLRLDAIHAIYDQSATPIVAEIVQRVRAASPRALVIAESGLNDPQVIRPRARGGLGCHAQWADDFHHALRTLLTDEREGYYEEFGRVADLAKAYLRPFVHDGQYSSFRKRRFGAPAWDRATEQFVVFSQNHDQVGNRAFGDRLPAHARRLAAFCVLLSPFTPMLFMGEEYGESAPFQFFTDHIDERIAQATREGRRQEFAAFASFGEEIPDPQDPQTFARSKLGAGREEGLEALYAELLRWRRTLGGEVEHASFDEHPRWLRLRRGAYEMICNFADGPQTLPAGGEVLLCTHPTRTSRTGLRLPAFSGVLVGPRPPARAGGGARTRTRASARRSGPARSSAGRAR